MNEWQENIEWERIEPANEKGEAAGYGTWGTHVYVIHPLQNATFACLHVHNGVVRVLASGVSGHRAWREARNDCTRHQCPEKKGA